MSLIFLLLFIISIVLFPLYVFKPKLFNRNSDKHYSRKQISVIFGAIIISFFVLFVLTGNNSEVKNANNNNAESNSLAKEMTPEQTFQEVGKNTSQYTQVYATKEGDEWVVTALIQSDNLFTGIDDFAEAKLLARTFIFGVFATKQPIKHVTLSINNTSLGKYYRAGLGKDVAATQSLKTWTNNEVGPTIFYNFLKTATNGSTGDYKNSTYVETNLK